MIRHEDCIVHLDTKDAAPIVKELRGVATALRKYSHKE